MKSLTLEPKPLNWGRIIKKALLTGKFSAKAKRRAGSWMTCAVGEQMVQNKGLQNRPLRVHGPKDKTLETLGVNFMYQVADDHVADAAKLYVEIRTRVAEIGVGL